MTTKTDVFCVLTKLTGNKRTHTYICCVGQKRICPEKIQPDSVRLGSETGRLSCIRFWRSEVVMSNWRYEGVIFLEARIEECGEEVNQRNYPIL